MQELLQKELIGRNGPLKNSVIKKMDLVGGGCIHQTWRLHIEGDRKVFIKVTSHKNFPRLQFEAQGLKALNNFSNTELLVIPKPLAIQRLENFSILLLPWLNFGSGNQVLLGKGLAHLHLSSSRQSNDHFGWAEDGFIGTGSQPGGFKKSWTECFTELRLKPQLMVANEWALSENHAKEFLKRVNNFLKHHNPIPALVHGDLWSGNCAAQEDGKGILIDPACWWADREVDIAMTRLFGGFSYDFYESYNEVWPIPNSAEKRTKIYNLYHLLNHANIFGGSYKDESLSLISKLERTIL